MAASSSRLLPIITASTLYVVHAHFDPLYADTLAPTKPIYTPFTPLGWGSNRYLTLFPDSTLASVKKPRAMEWMGGTPLRDVALGEKYGAAVDARGDCWMWGKGYDMSGKVGRSLRGKVSQAGARQRIAGSLSLLPRRRKRAF